MDVSNVSIVLPGTSLADGCVDIVLGVTSHVNTFPFRVSSCTLLFVFPAAKDCEAQEVLRLDPRPFAIRAYFSRFVSLVLLFLY
jgi:hypothetical protein